MVSERESTGWSFVVGLIAALLSCCLLCLMFLCLCVREQVGSVDVCVFVVVAGYFTFLSINEKCEK